MQGIKNKGHTPDLAEHPFVLSGVNREMKGKGFGSINPLLTFLARSCDIAVVVAS
jgi:hypothetical protein